MFTVTYSASLNGSVPSVERGVPSMLRERAGITTKLLVDQASSLLPLDFCPNHTHQRLLQQECFGGACPCGVPGEGGRGGCHWRWPNTLLKTQGQLHDSECVLQLLPVCLLFGQGSDVGFKDSPNLKNCYKVVV